jgi:hypothetical protein
MPPGRCKLANRGPGDESSVENGQQIGTFEVTPLEPHPTDLHQDRFASTSHAIRAERVPGPCVQEACAGSKGGVGWVGSPGASYSYWSACSGLRWAARRAGHLLAGLPAKKAITIMPISAVIWLSILIIRFSWRRVIPIARSAPISRVRSTIESTYSGAPASVAPRGVGAASDAAPI